MPELFGKPFKHELRKEIRGLNQSLTKMHSDLRTTRHQLIFSQAKNRELTARNEQLVALAQEMLRIAQQPIEINAFEELQKHRRRLFDEAERASKSEQAA